jgi:hypothetical protein
MRREVQKVGIIDVWCTVYTHLPAGGTTCMKTMQHVNFGVRLRKTEHGFTSMLSQPFYPVRKAIVDLVSRYSKDHLYIRMLASSCAV